MSVDGPFLIRQDRATERDHVRTLEPCWRFRDSRSPDRGRVVTLLPSRDVVIVGDGIAAGWPLRPSFGSSATNTSAR